MIPQKTLEKLLRDHLLGDGSEGNLNKKISQLATRLSHPARLWAEHVSQGNEPSVSKAKVRAHLFLGIALVDDDQPYNPDVEGFAYDITRGEMIGAFLDLDSTDLSPTEVIPALLEIGNDGAYFGDDVA